AYREQKRKERELVEAMFQEEAGRVREQQAQGRALVQSVHEEAVEHLRGQGLPVPEPPTIHHTELPAAEPEGPLRQEWETYRREVGRFLAEGHDGRHVLIKGDQVIGLWATHVEALIAGYERFLGQPF